MASGIAELLALEGRDVEFVTGYGMVAPFADETLEAYLVIQRLHELGVAIRRGTSLVGVGDRALEVEDEFGNPHELSSAGVVLVTQRVSRDALFHELDGVREGLYRIGDCVAPRLLAEAIFDGHRLAREIDSPDPEIALPYLRERPLDDPVEHPPPGRLLELPLPPVPRSRDLELLDTDAPVRSARVAAPARISAPTARWRSGWAAGSWSPGRRSRPAAPGAATWSASRQTASPRRSTSRSASPGRCRTCSACATRPPSSRSTAIPMRESSAMRTTVLSPTRATSSARCWLADATAGKGGRMSGEPIVILGAGSTGEALVDHHRRARVGRR